MSLTVLLGGARSGKSSLAVEIGRRYHGPVVFIATAPPIDADMQERIEHHRSERPASWVTVEEPVELRDALNATGHDALVIVDCLTLWVSNLMYAGRSDADVCERAATSSALAAARQAPVVAISNEVGMGIHPESPLGRRYRDLLGRVNQIWTAAADTSLLLVAGRAIPLSDPWQHLELAADLQRSSSS
jgi:adenosyl cobinamide kinase/adenosyl cobinamide phosphate guanylyltransferase